MNKQKTGLSNNFDPSYLSAKAEETGLKPRDIRDAMQLTLIMAAALAWEENPTPVALRIVASNKQAIPFPSAVFPAPDSRRPSPRR
jgi:hypothetical protein